MAIGHEMINDPVVLALEGRANGFDGDDAAGGEDFRIRCFDRFQNGTVAKNPRNDERILRAPVFGLDVVFLATDLNI